jgi:hypothetical protein
MTRYYNFLVGKVFLLMSQLAPLVKFGNSGHRKFMSEIDVLPCVKKVQDYRLEPAEGGKHVCLCGIPGVSQVRRLDFVGGQDNGAECAAFKWGCTQPFY